MTEPERWMVKVRRPGGGESVVGEYPDRGYAELVAANRNADYQSDDYYVEEFDIDKQDWPGGRP